MICYFDSFLPCSLSQIFNLAFFFSDEIQEEYKRRNGGQENLVRANDVFFAVHALILSTFTLVQTWVYKVFSRLRLAENSIVIFNSLYGC